jgi:ferredoxin
MITQADIDELAAALGPVGLNRCRLVAVADLPTSVWLPGVNSQGRPDPESSLLVVGHAGPALWSFLDDRARRTGLPIETGPDPIDTFSVTETEAVLRRFLPDTWRRLLYPHERCPVDLVALGAMINWQTTSPLGLGIHHRYGLWSAFRAVWEIGDDIEATAAPLLPDVCAHCSSHDCVAACPVGAVRLGHPFDVAACFDHRAPLDSECGETCLARLACPVGPEFRYESEQLAYHYRRSRPGPRG